MPSSTKRRMTSAGRSGPRRAPRSCSMRWCRGVGDMARRLASRGNYRTMPSDWDRKVEGRIRTEGQLRCGGFTTRDQARSGWVETPPDSAGNGCADPGETPLWTAHSSAAPRDRPAARPGAHLRYYNTEPKPHRPLDQGRLPTRSSGRPHCGTRSADASPQLGDWTTGSAQVLGDGAQNREGILT